MNQKNYKRRNSIASTWLPTSLSTFMSKSKDSKNRKTLAFGEKLTRGVSEKNTPPIKRHNITNLKSENVQKLDRKHSLSFPNLLNENSFKNNDIKKNTSSEVLDDVEQLSSKDNFLPLKSYKKKDKLSISLNKDKLSSPSVKSRRSSIVAVS